MRVKEIGYYYGGGKNLDRVYDCLKAIQFAPKDESFWPHIEKRLKELKFVDAWGGVNPTIGLLINWGFVSHKKMAKISYTTISKEEHLELTNKGKKFLNLNKTEQDKLLLEHALDDGLLAILELIYERTSQSQRCTLKWLMDNWNEKVGLPAGKWSSEYTRGQNVDTRRSWAKYFGLISEKGRPISFYLTSKGLAVLREYGKGEYAKTLGTAEIEKRKKEEYSHSDMITVLLDIGKTLGFDVQRTPHVNELLPEDKQMKKRIKVLDCVWRIYQPFIGNIWVPIEVQKGGSIEDALIRLNIVADYSHKTVIVCDKSEKEIIKEMAKAQRKIPMEKLVLFSFEEIKQLKAAVDTINQMKKKLIGAQES